MCIRDRSELNQLLLDFDHNIEFNEHDYYVSRSNYLAFNLIQNWPKWERKILNFSGDTFSGKTHLAKIFQDKSNALYLGHSDINEDVFKKIKLNETIVIDDFEIKPLAMPSTNNAINMLGTVSYTHLRAHET